MGWKAKSIQYLALLVSTPPSVSTPTNLSSRDHDRTHAKSSHKVPASLLICKTMPCTLLVMKMQNQLVMTTALSRRRAAHRMGPLCAWHATRISRYTAW